MYVSSLFLFKLQSVQVKRLTKERIFSLINMELNNANENKEKFDEEIINILGWQLHNSESESKSHWSILQALNHLLLAFHLNQALDYNV